MGDDSANRRLQALVSRQDGLLKSNQLASVGMTRAALRWRVRTGRWQRVLPGVYLTNSGAMSHRQRHLSASLYAGPGAQLTGAAALLCYGMRYIPGDRFVRVLVPAHRQVRSAGYARIHRTKGTIRRPTRFGPLAVCDTARAVADAARSCASERDVRALVAQAVQRRITSVAHLRAELDHGPRAHSALLRKVLNEVADGVRSAPEAELRTLVASSSILPRVLWNPSLCDNRGVALPTPDGWIDEVAIALEVDSREHHLSPEDWQRTMARHNLLAEHGALILHFPPSQIRRSHATVLRTIERAYLARLRAGAAHSVMIKVTRRSSP